MRKPRFDLKRTSSITPGEPPGTIIIDPESKPPRIDVYGIGDGEVHEENDCAPERIAELRAEFRHLWISVDGLGDAGVLTDLRDRLGMHRLALEDVVNTGQRPKVEEYDNQLFIVTRTPDDAGGPSRQLSLFLGPDFLATFQDGPQPCLAHVLRRLREGRPKLRNAGPDYLCYAILDAAVDSYFPVLDAYGDRLEELEDAVTDSSDAEVIARLHAIGHELASIRRALRAIREMLTALLRLDLDLIRPETAPYLRDCQDHATLLLELADSYRDHCSSLVDLHLSLAGHRMNEVMKVLTIIATIFIPLSFVAGLYGMNFDTSASRWNMPELGSPWGYPIALGAMALMALGMLVQFARKGWIRLWRGRRDR